MSDHRTDEAPSREFVPAVKPLENRSLLSSTASAAVSPLFLRLPLPFSPVFMHLPRTGGVSAQTGSQVAIGVGQPTTNTVQINDDGKGDVQAEWNGGPTHSFSGVASTIIQAERSRTNQISIVLTGNRTSPTALAVGSLVATEATIPGRDAHAGDLAQGQDQRCCRPDRLAPDGHRQPAHDRRRAAHQRGRGRGPGGMEWRSGPLVLGRRGDRGPHQERQEGSGHAE